MEWNGKHIFFLNMLSFIIQGAVFAKYIILTSWRPLIHTDNHSVHLLHWVITKIIWRKKTPQSCYQYISNEEDDVISWAELSTPDASNILCVNTSGHPNTTHTHTPPHHERRCARGRDMQTNKHTCARKHTHMLFIMGLSVFTHTHTGLTVCLCKVSSCSCCIHCPIYFPACRGSVERVVKGVVAPAHYREAAWCSTVWRIGVYLDCQKTACRTNVVVNIAHLSVTVLSQVDIRWLSIVSLALNVSVTVSVNINNRIKHCIQYTYSIYVHCVCV